MTNIALILTTYHSLERIPMYKERIIWWLDNSKLDLFIVDSNNSNFDYLPEKYLNNNRLHLYSFDQRNDIIKANSLYNKKGFMLITYCEVLSIKNILTKYDNLFSKYDWIFKLTGKYIIPTLEIELNNIPNNSDIIVQNRHNNIIQNSELFGFKLNKSANIFNSFDVINVFERSLKLLIESDNYILYRLPLLKIPPEYYIKRTNGSILGDL
jgi:hypothetical protein